MLASLGDGWLYRGVLFLKLFFRFGFHPISMHLRANGVSFLLSVRSHEELMLLYEIFCRRIYDFSLASDAEYVVDCGANCGISSLFLYTLYPSARILAVEPNPALFPRLQETVRPYKNILPVQCAVGAVDGEASFFVSPHATTASSLLQRSSEDKEYRVPVKTLKTILTEHGFPRVDVLKFDIEGAEEHLFTDSNTKDKIRFCVGEVHEDLMGVSLQEFLSTVQSGFSVSLVPTKKQKRFIMSAHTIAEKSNP